jgi:hypothetical protein
MRANVMAIDIVGMIRGRKQARVAGIEELAKRLAAGETVPPEEVEAILDHCGCDEVQLQERVDAIERRAALIASVARGEAAQVKIDRIDAECNKAWQAVADAQQRHAGVVAKHADELLTLRQSLDAANRAADELLSPENLSPADRERLAEARKAASAAAQAASDLRRNMPELRMSLENAEREAVGAIEDAKVYRNNSDAQDRKARAENAVRARTARLKEAETQLPKLVAEGERTAAALAAVEDGLQR